MCCLFPLYTYIHENFSVFYSKGFGCFCARGKPCTPPSPLPMTKMTCVVCIRKADRPAPLTRGENTYSDPWHWVCLAWLCLERLGPSIIRIIGSFHRDRVVVTDFTLSFVWPLVHCADCASKRFLAGNLRSTGRPLSLSWHGATFKTAVDGRDGVKL